MERKITGIVFSFTLIDQTAVKERPEESLL